MTYALCACIRSATLGFYPDITDGSKRAATF